MSSFDMHIVRKPVSSLRPHQGHARTHSKKQIKMVADSIRAFGFINPALIDANNNIVAGHGRIEAAKLLGITEVPTLSIRHLSSAQLRAYRIADNRLAELAGWDMELVALEVFAIEELDPEFELTLTGYEIEEIDLLRDLGGNGAPAAQPPVPCPTFDKPATSRPGDLWCIGEHRLLCGDARDARSYRDLMAGRRADLVITDPPFNVKIDGHVSGLGKIKHREFAMASGEMTPREFEVFLGTVLSQMARASRSGSLHYVFMDWAHIDALIAAGKATYHQFVNLAVWAKTNGGMGSLYRSRHELVAVFKHGRRPHVNNVALGKNGRNRTNVWEYAGANSFGGSRDEDLAMHPTVKPTAMIADAILDASDAGDLVLDPFAGSGTTLMACEQTRRHARLIELDPHYCDLIVSRAAALGLSATLAATGKSFEQVAAERAIVGEEA